MTAREAFYAAYRAARILRKHRVAGQAELAKLPAEATRFVVQAFNASSLQRTYISGATAARVAAAKYGMSRRWAIKNNLRAVRFRAQRRAMGLRTPGYGPFPLPKDPIMPRDIFPHMTTRQLLNAYAATATWDYRKDQYADALSARGYDWGDHDASDYDDRHERELDAMAAQD